VGPGSTRFGSLGRLRERNSIVGGRAQGICRGGGGRNQLQSIAGHRVVPAICITLPAQHKEAKRPSISMVRTYDEERFVDKPDWKRTCSGRNGQWPAGPGRQQAFAIGDGPVGAVDSDRQAVRAVGSCWRGARQPV